MAVKLSPKNTSITLSGETVVVKSDELVNSLIRDQKQVVDFLSKELSSISLAEISVDSHGTVLISNAAFVNAVQNKFSGVTPLSNGTCGAGC